ncbi:hypothetical protein ACIQZG_10240 [Lysinibacillus sp. NPDC096418]|uniref:hypothetical protein n=1 Tax=Lysinibacillus sp. NPDC096418 TaxID=3364138 RepID=UPI0038309C3B
MKKLFIVLLTAFVFAVVNPTKSEAKVMYDGAEVVKGQTGKMTFKKDIKVYKKNPDGTFDSLMVKRNNFFKTYDIEKYDGKTFYQMGQYRVQATDLVVFKEVPIKIRSSFYNNPTYIYINRNQSYDYKSYGNYFNKDYQNIKISFLNNGQVISTCFYDADAGDICIEDNGTDIKIAETIKRETGVRYEITADVRERFSPVEGYAIGGYEHVYLKGMIVSSKGTEINGYLDVLGGDWKYPSEYSWVPINLLKQVEDK